MSDSGFKNTLPQSTACSKKEVFCRLRQLEM